MRACPALAIQGAMKIFALFSGQGAQKVGMGKDLAEAHPDAAAWIDRADGALEIPLKPVMFDGPVEELTRTAFCQPALFVHGLACLELLKHQVPGLEVIGAAGLSLGEFTAHAAAGSFTFGDGLQLVARRGAAMEKACQQTSGGMAAMIGGDENHVIRLAQEAHVDVANFNAPGQIVLSGPKEGIALACEKAKDFGVRRAIPLEVAGAYHSRLMESAQATLALALAETAIVKPEIPVWCNVDGRGVLGPEDIRDTLTRQVTGSVRWVACMEQAIARFGQDTVFVEFGPGKVLAGLMAKIHKETVVHSIEDVASLEAAVAALA